MNLFYINYILNLFIKRKYIFIFIYIYITK